MLAVWLIGSGICLAQTDPAAPPPLSSLHAEDRPRQVVLREAVSFAIVLDGREAGTVLVPAQTAVDLVSVEEDGLHVLMGANRAVVAPEKTDLWDRVRAIRGDRASRPDPALADPAMDAQLPSSSQAADWYGPKVAALDAWLAKYPDHPRAAEVKERHDALVQEAGRVAMGERRRGEQWFAPAEAAARADEFAADDLRAALEEAGRAHDGHRLLPLIPQISRYNRVEIHPRLVHAALDAVAAVMASLTPEGLTETLKQARAADVAARDQGTADLRAIVDHPVPGVSSPSNATYRQYDDNLYRPPGTYVTAHHYGELQPYYSNPKGIYPTLAPDVLADAQKRARAIAAASADIVRIDRDLANVGGSIAQQRQQWEAQQKILAAIPLAAEEKALAALAEAAPLPLEPALAKLSAAASAWPDGAAVAAAIVARAQEAATAVDAAVAADHIPEALRLAALTQKVVETVHDSSPGHEEALRRMRDLNARLAALQPLHASFTQKDYAAVAEGRLGNDFPASFQQWLAALQEKAAAQEEASRAQFAAAEAALKGFQPQAAYADFTQAKELWPGNPQIPPCVNGLRIAAGVGAVLALLLLLALWSGWSAFWEKQRYRNRLKKQMKATAKAQEKEREKERARSLGQG
jgi:hypothetical protein